MSLPTLEAPPSVDPAPVFTHTDSVGPADDLQRMKGVGPKFAALLNSLGITRFAQVASWNPDDIAMLEPRLGVFAGRIERAICLSRIVFPPRGGATMIPRWPLPNGAIRSITRTPRKSCPSPSR